MVAAMLAGTTAWGQLYVAGHEIDITGTTEQAITGSGISGKVTYYPTSKRLVLEDATITAGENDGIYNKSVDGLYIYFVGTVRITTSSSGTNVAGIYCQGNTYLMPYGNSLHAPTVTVSNTGAGPAIKSIEGADVTVYSINLTAAASNNHAIYAQNAASLYVTSSTLTARTADLKCRAITGFTGGLNPHPSASCLEVFNNSSHEFDTASGSVVHNGTPVRNTMLVPSIMIGDLALGSAKEITTTTTGASSVSGSVTFNPADPIPWLELDNFSMTGKSIVCRIPNLEVRIKGINTINTTDDNAAAIQIYANTTFTGAGALKVESTGSRSYAFSIERDADVTFNINALEAKATTCAFKGESNGTLTLNRYSDISIYKFLGGTCNVYTGNLVMNGMGIWTTDTYFNPKEYKIICKDRVACGSDLTYDGTWFISTNAFTQYPIIVCGIQVNERNCNDIPNPYITGGKVSYDTGTNTLHISGDCTYNGCIVDSNIEGLTISVDGNTTLTTNNGGPVILLDASTTITGGKLTLKSETEDNDALGIKLDPRAESTLTIKDADIEVVGDGFSSGICGFFGSSLIIDNSDITVSAHDGGCIYDWSGITLTNCHIEQPKVLIIGPYGIFSDENHLIGSSDDIETLVIKAGNLKGDVNGDGDVNTADVTAVYGYIINGEKSGFTKEAANVNGDGDVNTADVTAIYSIIIGGSSGSKKVYEMLLEMEE